jgi:SAM-dependent methyltransferase
MNALPRRHADFAAFVLAQLPRRRVRLLEVGCGAQGELAYELEAAGCLVTAIDPQAPEGALFRRERLEDFAVEEPFDVVVTNLSLHHVHDLRAALERIAGLLVPGGLLVLSEFAHERLTGPTALWYHERRRERDGTLPASPGAWLREWRRDHSDLHSAATMRRELAARFVESSFEWTPYLYGYGLDDALEPVERRLIEAGALDAVGFRWVGSPRR